MRLHLPSCWGGVGNYIFLSGPPRTTTSSTSSSASGVRLRFGVDFGSALTSVRQPFDGLPELMLCFASAPTSVPFPSWCCASVRRPISDGRRVDAMASLWRHLRFGGHYLYWLPSSILIVEEEDNTTWLLLCLFPWLLPRRGGCCYCRMRTLMMMIIFYRRRYTSSLDNGDEHDDDDDATVRFSKRWQSTAIDRHRWPWLLCGNTTTRMRMIVLRVCFCHLGFNNDCGGTILVLLGIITAIINGSDNNYSSHRSSMDT